MPSAPGPALPNSTFGLRTSSPTLPPFNQLSPIITTPPTPTGRLSPRLRPPTFGCVSSATIWPPRGRPSWRRSSLGKVSVPRGLILMTFAMIVRPRLKSVKRESVRMLEVPRCPHALRSDAPRSPEANTGSYASFLAANSASTNPSMVCSLASMAGLSFIAASVLEVSGPIVAIFIRGNLASSAGKSKRAWN